MSVKTNTINKQFPVHLFLALTLITSFSLITIIIPNVIVYAFLFATVTIGALYQINLYKFVDRKLSRFLIFFLLPSIIGIFSYFIGLHFESSTFDYGELNPFGRIFNLFLMFSFITLVHSYSVYNNNFKVFNWYKIGVSILLITAIWQTVSIYTGFIPFPFETRAHLHSTYGNEFSFSKRITGLAAEPSYFTMFTIDFIALSLLLNIGKKRIIYILTALFLMILSLSPSGYLTLMATFAGAYIFTNLIKINNRINIKKVSITIVLLISIAIFIYILLKYDILDYIILRITNPEMLQSARAYMSYMPFVLASESNILSFLFGHGIKSYSIIGTAFSVPDGDPVHITSNNIYVDTFWESGLIGLLTLLSFFLYCFVKIIKSPFSKLQIFISFFILFDLIFSGIFRADFASIRFFILLYLLFILINYDLFKKENNVKNISFNPNI